jgi:hypothetical protein
MARPRRVLTTALTVAVLVGLPAVPAWGTPSGADSSTPARVGAPHTLAAATPASTSAVSPGFRADFVAVTWTGAAAAAQVRFRHGGAWGPWQDMGEDGVEEPGRFGSALVPAHHADGYQVRVPAGVRAPRTVAINTTDGSRAAATPVAAAAATASAPTYLSRAAWGADETLRFDSAGHENWPAEYFPVQKLTVHHTATANGDPDPAATVRAIYRYHAIDRGWGDIGYQFLVDEAGRVYEGRHTDDDAATPMAFDASGRGVVGAHVAGWNSGNIGISLLGTLTDRRPTAAAQRALEQVLADLAARTRINPTGSGTYTNPVNGSTWTGANVPGHRDFGATECPGGVTYALLPTIRQRVAAREGGTLVEDDVAPVLSSIGATLSGTTATLTWSTSADRSDSQVQYWPRATPATVASTPLGLQFVTGHRVTLSGLRRGTTYGYRLFSADIAGNRGSSTEGATSCRDGGDEGNRTPNPRLAKAVLCQLSYVPEGGADGSVDQRLDGVLTAPGPRVASCQRSASAALPVRLRTAATSPATAAASASFFSTRLPPRSFVGTIQPAARRCRHTGGPGRT